MAIWTLGDLTSPKYATAQSVGHDCVLQLLLALSASASVSLAPTTSLDWANLIYVCAGQRTCLFLVALPFHVGIHE